MAKQILPAFSKGEISPQLLGRVETQAFKTGLATAKNMSVKTYGGAERRQGLRFLNLARSFTTKTRLIPFTFKTEDQYMLEFGVGYMRVTRNGVQVRQAGSNIVAISQTNPGVVQTAASHGFVDGQDVFLTGIVGMAELNNTCVIVRNPTNTTFEIQSPITGQAIDTSLLSVYQSGGQAAAPFEIATPYDEASLCDLKYNQTADVMTLTHPRFAPLELSRQDHDDWTLFQLDFRPSLDSSVALAAIPNPTGALSVVYKVTAVDSITGEESLPSLGLGAVAITNITQAFPAVATTGAPHNLQTGDEIELSGVGGMVEVEGQRFLVAVTSATTFELIYMDGFDVDSAGFTAFTGGGLVTPAFVRVPNSSTNFENTISWVGVSGVTRYRIYRRVNGVFGKIGESTTTSFVDSANTTPDESKGPPVFRNPFRDTNTFPAAVGFYQQRKVFGGSNLKPDTSEFSGTGSFSNFTKSDPIQDDDAISATLAANEINDILHYVSLNELLVFTSGSEWEISSTSGAGLTPSTITQRTQSNWGSSQRRPIVMGPSVIFVTRDGSSVRSFGFSENIRGYTGEDLNVTAQHLTDGKEIVDWYFTNNPEKQIFMVLDDGTMATLTYDPELKTVGWTRWETDGNFKAVSGLREGGKFREDTLYFTVERFINGRSIVTIESWNQEHIADVRDCFYVDSGLTLDNPWNIVSIDRTSPVHIEIDGQHGYQNGDSVDLFDIQWDEVCDADGNNIADNPLNTRRYVIENVTATGFDLVNVDGTDFPLYIQGGTSRKPFSAVGGLWHLEGQEVDVLADGNVLKGLSITNGVLTLPRPFSRVHAGLKYISDCKTLPIENEQDSTVQNTFKKVNDVAVRMFKSRGLLIGPNPDQLVEAKQRDNENMSDPIDLLSGDLYVNLRGDWNSQGQILIRQVNPLPMTILAIIQQYDVGDA